MNENDLNNFQDFDKKQLVIKITGAVQESNLTDFEERALSVISSIKMELVTDEDFAEADFNTKQCKIIENRIASARQDAIMQTADIAAIIQTTERLEAKFRSVRLALEKKVVSEKELRKSEIINAGRNHLQGLVQMSPVKHGFSIDNKALTEAAKGKRSLDKIREAVSEVVEEEELRLSGMEIDFANCIAIIDASESEYPGLYPDKKTLALSPCEVVEPQIAARVATYKFNIAEKDRKEKEAIAELEKKNVVVENKPIETGWIPPTAPVDDPDPFTTPTVNEPTIGLHEYSVTIKTTLEENAIVYLLSRIPEIKGVKIA